MMKKLLMTTAIVEMATGIVLLAVPALLASILFGGALDTSTGLAVARVAGAALLSLGVACWFAGRDARSRAAIGIVAAMLIYNLAVVVLCLSSRYGAGMTGMGLLPASTLHSALAVWCIVCLRAA
jgi:membrane protease YdiL (CAAX protease family)